MVAKYELFNDERAQLEQLTSELYPYDPAEFAQFMGGCRRSALEISQNVLEWANRAHADYIGLLRNLPVGDDVPRTPSVKRATDEISMFSDRLMGLLAGLFGEIVTFEGKMTRRQIHNVYPAEDEQFSQLGASAEQLEWHVEDGFHPERANWLGILCLRPDPSVITWVTRARDLELSSNDWAALRSEPVKLLVDDSFEPGISGRPYPVLTVSGPTSDPEIAFDPPYTRYCDQAQRELAKRVCQAADRARFAITLRKGDFLILDNRRTVHARGSHQPRWDGTDRWIKRALICDPGERRAMAAPGLVSFAPAHEGCK